jgi:serine acetyltransferase
MEFQPMSQPIDAILIACWDITDRHLESLEINCLTTPIASRPMVQRSVEQLVAAGYKNILVVNGAHALACEHLLGHGERFGVKLHYVIAREGDHPLKMIGDFVAQASEHICIASASTVEDGSLHHRDLTAMPDNGPRILCTHDQTGLRWSGWGIFTRAQVLALFADCTSLNNLESRVLAAQEIEHIMCPAFLSLDSADQALLSVVTLLYMGQPGGSVIQRALRPGVWIAAGAQIDPQATLIAPVYIGHHVKVQAGAAVGPGAMIEDGVIIEGGAQIEDSWVLQNTFVGQETTLRHVIVSANRLINLDLGVTIKVPDALLLDGLATTQKDSCLPGMAERLTAWLLWLITLPLVQLICLRLDLPRQFHPVANHGIAFPDRMTDKFVAHPTAMERSAQYVREQVPYALALHFIRTFHPGLRDVWQGRVRLIGLEPRSLIEVASLAPHWQHLYADAAIGLLNESLLLGAESSDPILRYASDALAAQGMSVRRSFALLLRYTYSIFSSIRMVVANVSTH